MKKLPPFLDSKQASNVLNLPLQSVYRLCRQGRLPVVQGVKPYRIITAELNRSNGGRGRENQTKVSV